MMKNILLAAALTVLVSTAWGQNSGGVGTGSGSTGTGTVSGTGSGSTGRPSTGNGSINGTDQYGMPNGTVNNSNTGTTNRINDENTRRRATQYQDRTQPGAINNNGTVPPPRANEAY